MRPRAVAAVILAALGLLPLVVGRGTTADEPSLVDLLRSAGDYVVAYEDAFRVVVAEEEYVQRLRASPGGPVQQARRLRSDVAFVRVPGATLPWWLLRDVYEVDGGAVRDRQARLEKLLVECPATGLERARAIADEGARFNLGRGARNFNVPTLVLAFLHPSVQPRFSFERKGRTRRSRARSFVEIAFRELWRLPPWCAGPETEHPDVLAAGRVSDPTRGETARWVCTELVLELARRRDEDARHPRHGVQALPSAHPVGPRRDARPAPDGARAAPRGRSGSVEHVEGLAVYTGFRQAGVSTREEIRAPGPRGSLITRE